MKNAIKISLLIHIIKQKEIISHILEWFLETKNYIHIISKILMMLNYWENLKIISVWSIIEER
jgi:hypothetical protein